MMICEICIRDLEGCMDFGECVSFGGCASFILEFAWNREPKVTYLRAPEELDNKCGYFPR